jgi:hypothetical protein
MPPQAISLALFILQEAVTYGPELYADLAALFSKPDPTPEDWEALRSKVLAQTYAQLVPNSALPPDAPAAPALASAPAPAPVPASAADAPTPAPAPMLVPVHGLGPAQ